MYVRAKRQGGRTYHYLVTSERRGGRVCQKTVAYLGAYPSLAAALERLPGRIEHYRALALRCSQKADAAKTRCHPAWLERNGGEVPNERRRGVRLRDDPTKQYWTFTEMATAFEQRSRGLSARLAKLRALSEKKGVL